MVYDLSPGDVVHIGNAVALTVLAVEGDLIRFGLEMPEGATPHTGDVGKDGEGSDHRHRWSVWELN